MLSLKNIVKEYVTGDTTVAALKGVSIDFRDHEFVSILGHSGCGKTTLLNIVGGLDHYTTGDLVIRGKSTKEFKDADWDAYRNHSVGFVFQSYNLIPHQTVLSNVELALTLSGVSKTERRRRATEALTKVGLADQLHKKPNQMSGGQMQRVAIARALVNNPDILLADEPTGALDSATSVQIMDLLKEISKDKLIIMVTHNPELAELYSSRIVRLQDGLIISDSLPYDESSEAQATDSASPSTVTVTEPTSSSSPKKEKKADKRQKNKSMSYFTALSLSLNNLMTKKGRTFLTSFAGSIGIIGIALILALSNGIQLYINRVQEDTLSSYPITIESQMVDYTSLAASMMGAQTNTEPHDNNKIYSNTIMFDMMNIMLSEVQTNNLADFKSYLDSKNDELRVKYVNDIQYGYNLDLSIYASDTTNGITKLGMDMFRSIMRGDSSGTSASTGTSSSNFFTSSGMMSASMNIFTEMINNPDLIASQYDVIAGKMPESFDEVVLVVNSHNELSDMALYALGLKDKDELVEIMQSAMQGETFEVSPASFTYDELLNTTFKLVLPSDLYSKGDNGKWSYIGNNNTALQTVVGNGLTLKVVGILRPNEDAVSSSISGSVAYTADLTKYIINATNSSKLIQEQLQNPDTDILTGLPFPTGEEKELSAEEKAAAFKEYASSLSQSEKANLIQQIATTPASADVLAAVNGQLSAMSPADMRAMLTSSMTEQSGMDAETVAAYIAGLSDDEVAETLRDGLIPAVTAQMSAALGEQFLTMTQEQMAAMLDGQIAALNTDGLAALYDRYMPAILSESTYEENMAAFGQLDLANPSSINIYAKDFNSKEYMSDLIEEYNKGVAEKDQITYTDYVGLLMSSVSQIVNFVSYALIAFVSISLVVSSIMIGIITYISVLERTKEIGILRAIGASKRDISRVFNAETLIVGFAAGIMGIAVSLLLCLPINLIISSLADVNNIAAMPWGGALILVLLSVVLTTVAGLIPARMAAKKDPVEALRTE